MSDRHGLLRVEHADLGYRDRTVLRGVTVRVAQGEVVGVVGPSGAGKTTLLRAIAGEPVVHAGRVHWVEGPRGRSRPRLGLVPQLDAGLPDRPGTVEQMVLLGLAASSRRRPWFTRQERARSSALLARLGMGGSERRAVKDLSGGQYQRVLLARALVHRPQLLLLDEPTHALDLQARRGMLRLPAEVADDGTAVVLTTHDLNWVAAHLPRLVCLNGRVVADGGPTQVLRPDILHATYGARVQVHRLGEVVVVADAGPLMQGPVEERGVAAVDR